jgi:hypothetical protein
MKRIAAPLLAVASAISGCATPPSTTTSLTVLSEPSGAKISSEGLTESFAPYVVNYKKSDFANKSFLDSTGCLRAKQFVATWPSGHKQSTGVVTMCDGPGSTYTIVIKRDANAPGREIDYKFSAEYDLHVMRIKAAKDLEEQRKIDAMWNAIGASMSNMYKPTSPPTYDCTTRRGLSGSVDTTCMSR